MAAMTDTDYDHAQQLAVRARQFDSRQPVIIRATNNAGDPVRLRLRDGFDAIEAALPANAVLTVGRDFWIGARRQMPVTVFHALVEQRLQELEARVRELEAGRPAEQPPQSNLLSRAVNVLIATAPAVPTETVKLIERDANGDATVIRAHDEPFERVTRVQRDTVGRVTGKATRYEPRRRPTKATSRP